MRIGIIGGLDRAQRDLEAMARSYGHELETHTGNLAGPCATAGLRSLVSRADLLLVLTDVNSHNAVKLARRLARRWNTPISLMRRVGQAQFALLLRGLGRPKRA
jgi:hypothetical protein